MTENFSTIVVCDTEYETSGGEFNLRPGDLPVPLCLEHVPPQLNQGDSRGAEDGRV